MTTTEEALPYIEALMDFCHAARGFGHAMLPAKWEEGALVSECARCWAFCTAYRTRRDGEWRLIEYGGHTMRPCIPSDQARRLRALVYEEAVGQ